MVVLGFGAPASVLILIAFWACDRRRSRRGASGGRLSAMYTDEITALFYGTKRIELDHRESMSMLRQEQAQGAPPRMSVDLDGGTATFRVRRRRSKVVRFAR